jgi:hypothetical protein
MSDKEGNHKIRRSFIGHPIWMLDGILQLKRRGEPTMRARRQFAEIEALQTFQCIV